MGGLWIVLVAEYRRRIVGKAFLFATFLGPLAILGVIGIVGITLERSAAADAERMRTVAVADESGRILPRLADLDDDALRIVEAPQPLTAARQALAEGDFDVLVVLPREAAAPEGPTRIPAYAPRQLSLGFERTLARTVLDAVRMERLARFELPPDAVRAMEERLRLDTVAVSEAGEAEAVVEPVVVGFALSMAMFMVMALYGGLVMQTALEEKTSRMAEILMASVRPFGLMLGKILAVGALALTQFAVWGAMLAAAVLVAFAVVPPDALTELGVRTGSDEDAGLETVVPAGVWPVAAVMLPLGYLLYASLFAALGAMYETAQDAQLGVTIAMTPLLGAVLVVQTARVAPDSTIIAIVSLFPFTAPVMLPTRMLLTDVPAWQVGLGIALCAATAVAVVWLAGRVFRGSILLLGTKPGWRDAWRIMRGA